MKIYNRKRFAAGLGSLVLAAAGLGVFWYLDFRSFDLKTAVIFSLLLLFAAADISRSLSKELARRDRVEQRDERNRLLALKCRAKSQEFLNFVLFFITAGCMAGFGITKETAFLWVFLGAAVPFGLLQISVVILTFWYEKHG